MSDLTDKAQQLLAHRVSAIEGLEKATLGVERAEAARATAWSDALKAGWTKSELAKLGLKAPSDKRGRRAKRGNTSGTGVQLPPAPDDHS